MQKSKEVINKKKLILKNHNYALNFMCQTIYLFFKQDITSN